MRARVLAILLAAILVIGLIPAGVAESGYIDIKARDVIVNRYSDHLGCKMDGSDYYGLIDAYGKPVTEAIYTSMSAISSQPFFKVSVRSQDGVHDDGIIDADGNVMVPAKYADVSLISDRWATGIKLVPSNADDKDYTFTNWNTNEKNFYRIDTVDFYFRGTLVGTLTRSEYDGYPTAYGDYICVTARDKTRVFYNSKMEKSPVSGDVYGEYNSAYKNRKYTYTHNGSGQIAFAEGCTLTENEVVKAYQYENGQMINLQGQVAFKPAQNYDSIYDFKGGYANVSMNRKKGLIDKAGKEILPVEYDDVGNYEANPFKYGCISAVKDGKFGFVNLENQVTCEFKYSSDIVSNRATFASIKNLDGTIIVLSGLVGELPDHYAEANFIYDGAFAFEAKNDQNQVSLINLYGETMIPYVDAYNISYNCDATVAAINLGSRTYRIYHFDAPKAPAAKTEGKTETGVAEDGTWTCENGHGGNSGKFCSECGAPRPPMNVTCSGCGTEYEAGSVPNFCPECGTKLK